MVFAPFRYVCPITIPVGPWGHGTMGPRAGLRGRGPWVGIREEQGDGRPQGGRLHRRPQGRRLHRRPQGRRLHRRPQGASTRRPDLLGGKVL